MAHYQQLKFIKLVSKFFNWQKNRHMKILEIGSFCVNDTIRKFLPQDHYIGVDLTKGPGVDVIGDGHKLDYEDNYFDLVISCEVFEHNPYYRETFENMYRMTKQGGFCCFTCASTGRLEHGTKRTVPSNSPGSQSVGWDYYKNISKNEFSKILTKFDFEFIYLEYNKFSKDLYFVGKKPLDVRVVDKNSISLSEFSSAVSPAFVSTPGQKQTLRFTLTYHIPLKILEKLSYNDKIYQNLAINFIKIRNFLVKLIKNILSFFDRKSK